MKNPPARAKDVRDAGSIPGSGRSHGEGNSNPLQHSCLGSPMDREACQGPWGHKTAGHNLATKQQQTTQIGFILQIHKSELYPGFGKI